MMRVCVCVCVCVCMCVALLAQVATAAQKAEPTRPGEKPPTANTPCPCCRLVRSAGNLSGCCDIFWYVFGVYLVFGCWMCMVVIDLSSGYFQRAKHLMPRQVRNDLQALQRAQCAWRMIDFLR